MHFFLVTVSVVQKPGTAEQGLLALDTGDILTAYSNGVN